MAKIVITAPHSSNYIPPGFLHRFCLPTDQMEAIYDLGTYEVAKLLSDKNIIVLPAHVSRLIVDLNRFSDDNRNIGIFREKTFRGSRIFIKGRKFSEKKKNY